jgi:hypothetical protein
MADLRFSVNQLIISPDMREVVWNQYLKLTNVIEFLRLEGNITDETADMLLQIALDVKIALEALDEAALDNLKLVVSKEEQ